MARRDFSKFQGKLPLLPSKMLDRKKISRMYGFSVPAIFKAYQSWINIFERNGSNLTFEQYLNKLVNANLSPNDIGKRNGKYQLARFNDEGVYTETSCRFILQKENLSEQKKIYKNKNLDWNKILKDLQIKSTRTVSREHSVDRRSIRKVLLSRVQVE